MILEISFLEGHRIPSIKQFALSNVMGHFVHSLGLQKQKSLLNKLYALLAEDLKGNH